MTIPAAAWPHYEQDEIDAVVAVLESGKANYWTGSQGRDFEREFAEFTGLRHAVFVANGTVAIELALRALDLPPGSEVVTTPHTFIATASAIVAAGLKPVFADIDPDSGNITPDSIQATLTDATSAVVVVHLGGWPARMIEIQALCSDHGLRLVEDCAQAHGAMIADRHVGTFSDIAAWSFCQDKIVSTGGEGGMVATDDEDLWRRMWSYKDHGKSWEAVYEREHPPGFRWLHESFGTNWRGTEMQAAIGRIQYRKLPQWRQDRTRNALELAHSLNALPGVTVPLPQFPETHAFYRLYTRLDVDRLAPGWSRDRVIGELARRFGVTAFSGSCSEVYRESAFGHAGFVPKQPLMNARARGNDALAFQVHPGVTSRDIDAVVSALDSTLRSAMEAPERAHPSKG